jgi:hypothetical protein
MMMMGHNDACSTPLTTVVVAATAAAVVFEQSTLQLGSERQSRVLSLVSLALELTKAGGGEHK